MNCDREECLFDRNGCGGSLESGKRGFAKGDTAVSEAGSSVDAKSFESHEPRPVDRSSAWTARSRIHRRAREVLTRSRHLWPSPAIAEHVSCFTCIACPCDVDIPAEKAVFSGDDRCGTCYQQTLQQ